MISCTKEKPKEPESIVVKKEYTPEKNEVEVFLLKKETFQEEILSNGKLVAVQKNDLKFEVSGNLEKLYVKEGDYVSKGSVLAELKKYKYEQELKSAKTTLKKTLLELEDMLIGRGYDLKEKEKIPVKIYEMAGLRSGYTEAQQKVEKAQQDVNSSSLRSPFKGKVATIKFKQYEQVGAGSLFLTLINDEYFEVEFYVTESEIHKVKKGEKVLVTAIGSQREYKGKIITINPLVEKNGTVLIKAQIKNDGNLIEGMNVNVRIEKGIPNQFIIPKSAIVLRQNQEVLFKVIKGRAYWNYVKITNENKNQYTIIPNPDKSSATLKVGDTLITKGNLNLAHDSDVTIKN
ncbi:MAG: efflux RND transporter periplasmic adaptor subunit [Flavobacteriaceae bacterium]